MAYEGYNIYLQYQASTPKAYMEKGLQERINRDFEDTLNFFTIQKKDRLTGAFSDIDVRIVNYGQENSFFWHDNFKRIIFSDLDYNVYMGDIFSFQGYRWLVIQAKSKNSVTSSCVVQRCNTVLKFTESTPLTEDIIEIDCIAQSRIYDTSTDKFIDLPQGKLKVMIPYDQDSIKIHVSNKATRFLIGQKDWRGLYKAYEVENMDTVENIDIDFYSSTPLSYSGFLTLNLTETQIDRVNDNMDNGVAWQRYFGGGN